MFSLTWPGYMQIYWNKRKRLHKKRVQLPQDLFGTPTWPPFHCFGTPIWPPWRHVKTLYIILNSVHSLPEWMAIYMKQPVSVCKLIRRLTNEPHCVIICRSFRVWFVSRIQEVCELINISIQGLSRQGKTGVGTQ